ncbi:GNAT family N-acetyltransferase [Pseudorhodoferax sp.]|uniref:GNAT family N-acetyltransferase n=1 Tax=Pseudorhodoferax sp. TaxID=1993553 RepID=UPI002DD61D54|nr:GNAT family N-acetyltransferase [Pseudorhodoferax sp.]
MQIRPFEAADTGAAFQLLAANGWGHRIASQEHLGQLAAASQRVLVAVERQCVVGFARAITDGLSNGYLSMVVVDAAHRGQGIGTALVQHMVGTAPQVTWVLRAGRPGAAAFFRTLGFAASSEAMERPRQGSG